MPGLGRGSGDPRSGWSQQLDNRHNAARVCMDGLDDRELDHGVVADVGAGQRHCLVPRGCQ